MRTKRFKHIAFTISLFVFFVTVSAQPSSIDSTGLNKIQDYKSQAERMVHFLEYALNTLADDATPASEKDIVIKESYLKFFRNDKVQIEDDLDDTRDMPINKDVQAYLKDIDFFFKSAKFEFVIENIEHFVNENNVLYIKISINRLLTGITINNETVKSAQKRYIEINVNENENDLKIVSIYTTKLNANKELLDWWKRVPEDWKNYLKLTYKITDSVTAGRIKQLQEIEELNMSGMQNFSNWDILSDFSNLKKLNLSGSSVISLMPIRNYTKLEVLDISGTLVSDISMLKYITELRELYMFDTKVTEPGIIANFLKLEKINFENTQITDASFLSGLIALTDVRMSNTKIVDISPISKLSKLTVLKISNTGIVDLKPLSNLNSLTYLFAENTGLIDLSPLNSLKVLKQLYLNGCPIDNLDMLTGLPNLEMVFCDNTGISKEKADDFMSKHKKALVVYKSEVLLNWWKTMPKDWKDILSKKLNIGDNPDTEKLHKIIATETITISGNTSIRDIEPLRQLVDLKVLDISNTSVSNLQPISDLLDLKEINASNTEIRNLSPISKVKSLQKLNVSFTKIAELEPLSDLLELEVLIADSTGIASIMALSNLSKLTKVYVDNTKLDFASVEKFGSLNNKCLVVWQTDSLQKQWKTVSPEWQQIFKLHTALNNEPTREQLHAWITLKAVALNDKFEINDIIILSKLSRLESIQLISTSVSNLKPLVGLTHLALLQINNSPISELDALKGITSLVSLNIENTPVKSLKHIEGLKNLEYLNIAGTKIGFIKQVEGLFKLKSLDIYNSKVSNINCLADLKNLESLKCYNTGISSKKINEFKTEHPNCKVIYY